MKKEKKTEKMDEDCGGLKPFISIKAPTKKSTSKKTDTKKADTKKK